MSATASRLNLALWLAPVGLVWWFAIRHCSVEWSLNPQYQYGWAVPVLCLVLAVRELRDRLSPWTGQRRRSGLSSPQAAGILMTFGLLFSLTRLLDEANPDWRLVSWLLALEAVGLTLIIFRSLLHFDVGWRPVLFFLVAVPWPTAIEAPVVNSLAVLVANLAAEVLGWAGVPAFARGNLVELGSGVIGIDEACTGIRSFQASLMLALFFGAVYRLAFANRAVCILAGLGVSLLLNFARTVFLSLLMAKAGPAALESWHDAVGIIVPLGCFGLIWLFAHLFRVREWPLGGREVRNANETRSLARLWDLSSHFSRPPLVPIILLLMIGVAELGTHLWYALREAKLPPPITWHIDPPRDETRFTELPISANTRRILRFDEALNLRWSDVDNTEWQAVFLRWKPGKTALRLARNHTPADCLTAAGHNLILQSELRFVSACGLELPFRS